MKHSAFRDALDAEDLLALYRESRARSAEIFAIPSSDAYYDRPIPLRHPIAFYEGHLPAFAVNTLLKAALGREGIDADYELLFARGIDPESEAAAQSPTDVWPSRDRISSYAQTADARVEDALASAILDDDSNPLLRRGEAVFTILEHEWMHQETLLYILHNLDADRKRATPPLGAASAAQSPHGAAVNDLVAVPSGVATLGADPDAIGFGWDNEFPLTRIEVGAFSIQRHNVTNGEFLEFVDANGYGQRELWSGSAWEWLRTHGVAHPHFWVRDADGWRWRGQFESPALPASWPVYVTHAEATAYAKWRGMRVPTESEYHRAAFGTPTGEERAFPWGDALPDASRGNFGFARWDPAPVGSHPAGASAWGIHDLVGNGWEWTSTAFAGFPGFAPMASYPVYSADFFDGSHFVMKGASPVTAVPLIRRSFRNWFRAEYPHVYATFRCVV